MLHKNLWFDHYCSDYYVSSMLYNSSIFHIDNIKIHQAKIVKEWLGGEHEE